MNMEIPTQDFENGITKIIDHISELLNESELITTEKRNMTIGLGLYTYAIEEYGKVLLMKKHYQKDQESQNIPDYIFGIYNNKTKPHTTKFDEALKTLPDICRYITLGSVTVERAEPKMRTEKIDGDGEEVSIVGFATGIFDAGSIEANFEMRKLCFYIGWNEAQFWEHQYKPQREPFLNSIAKFREKLAELKNCI